MSGPRNAEERLRRLLVILPYLMERGEVPLAEVAQRFSMTEAQVTSDLELVAMCGLPPYVDEMIDVFVDDGVIVVGVPRLFTRPLRLTAPEAFSLLASGRTAMELPGFDAAGPLARGLEKLANALGAVGIETASSSDGTSGVAIDLDRPELTDAVIEAVADSAELRVAYYSPARDALTDRTLVPRHVFVDAGNWYVRADDGASGERRTFRIDRIERAERTGRVVDPDPGTANDDTGATPFFSDAEVPRATLRVAPRGLWIVDRYPVDAVVEPPASGRGTARRHAAAGWKDVTLPVASERWLARLLVRLGPDAELLSPADARPAVNDLAARMLGRYER